MDDTEDVIDLDVIREKINKVITKNLEGQNYVPQTHEQWTSRIIEDSLQQLASTNEELVAANPEDAKVFKFVVHCMLQQRTGAAIQSATCQYWDKATDRHLSIVWESEQMQCIVTVYCVLT